MQKVKAGIYFDEARGGAQQAYAELTEARRLRLRTFLEGLLETLLPPPKAGASAPNGVVQRDQFEWEPGCLVVWRVVLKPKQVVPSMTRIEAYRIEVLLILTDL